MKCVILAFILLLPTGIFAQNGENSQKFALVIGNGEYKNLNRLVNPVNDADDVARALEYLGFKVEKLLNANLFQMEEAVTRLKNRLNASVDTFGFFFYAGHGVQSNGENFLIPVGENIPSENYLRNRALSVQVVLDDLNDAGNSLNVVVLDACRDNPFSWSRSGSANRGLAFVSRQPADSIIVYATSAGQTASDGEGRNGLFTSQFLPNLLTPGLEVSEIFRRTGADVSRESANRQIPAIYSQFFGIAYLGAGPDGANTISKPSTLPWIQQPGVSQGKTNDGSTRLWSLGASVGSSFATPWLVGTIRGTIAPLKNSFLEIGFDLGMICEVADADYYSIYPFIHYSYYLPFSEKNGWYIGAGGCYLAGEYDFPEGKTQVGYFTASFTTGFNLMNFLDISYSLRTDFSRVINKFSVGYIYRF